MKYTKAIIKEELKKAIFEFNEEAESDSVKLLLQGKTETSVINEITKYYWHHKDIVDKHGLEGTDGILYIIDRVLKYGCSASFQNRIIKLGHVEHMGTVFFDGAHVKKPYQETDLYDLTWGYKGGGSVNRTATTILIKSLYNFNKNDKYYRDLAMAFADDFLYNYSQHSEHDNIEEEKVVAWVQEYIEEHTNNSSIVKDTCAELGITQKELADKLEVSPASISDWAKGNIPKMTELALKLLIENKELKHKLQIFKEAHKIASEL